MTSGISKSASTMFLMLNLVLYLIVISISGWAVNHGIEISRETAAELPIPARIFPIYFPFGNMATGFFVIFSLLAGVVGFITSFTCIITLFRETDSGFHAAAASSLTTLSLTLLAMGFSCKEINLGWTESHLRVLEVVMIIVSGTQLLCTGTIYAGIEDIFMRNLANRAIV